MKDWVGAGMMPGGASQASRIMGLGEERNRQKERERPVSEQNRRKRERERKSGTKTKKTGGAQQREVEP